MNAFTDVGQRVRAHLCYARVFGDALTEAQLVARCAPEDPASVTAELERLESIGTVERSEGYWFLAGSVVPGFGALKRERERAAQHVLEDHRRMLSFLKALPMVRMLAASGSVGWKNHVHQSDKQADLDLFIITAPSGVHALRLMLRIRETLRWLLTRLGMARKWATLCPNYVTEIGLLEVTNESFYTASDALNVRVLKGQDVYLRFLAANPWIARYYPRRVGTEHANGNRGSALAAALNAACFATMAGYAWTKGRLTGRPFVYSFGFRFDRINSLRRSAPGGGGYQPVVARRFHEIHTLYFGADPSLEAFLFPDTTETGVLLNGEHAASTVWTPLGYDE